MGINFTLQQKEAACAKQPPSFRFKLIAVVLVVVILVIELIILLISLAGVLVVLLLVLIVVIPVLVIVIIVVIRHCGIPPFYMVIFPQDLNIMQNK